MLITSKLPACVAPAVMTRIPAVAVPVAPIAYWIRDGVPGTCAAQLTLLLLLLELLDELLELLLLELLLLELLLLELLLELLLDELEELKLLLLLLELLLDDDDDELLLLEEPRKSANANS